MSFFGTRPSRNTSEEFNYYLDEATSITHSENDFFAINKLCWMIDEGIIKPDDAIQAIHLKVAEESPRTVMHGLKVLNAVFYKCGSIIHKVICTEFYMDLLKEIILTTEYTNVKETILNMLREWAENFKYFPQYSAPQKLLEELKNKEVPKSTNECVNEKTNGFNKTAEQSVKSTEKLDKNRLNETDLKLASSEADNNQSDAEFKKSEEEFKKSLHEYRRKKQMEYKKYRVDEGLPPLSSDEEDQEDVIKQQTKHSQASDWIKKEENSMQLKSPSSKLPKELQQVKMQRERLNSNIQQYRASKHDEYVQSNDCASMDMQKCTDEGGQCAHCKKFRTKVDTEEFVVPKRLTYDMRKVIESKQRISKSFEEIKKIKKEDYYKKKQPLSSVKINHEKMELSDSALKDSDSEDETLKKAILLSEMEMRSKLMTAEPEQSNYAVNNTSLSEELDEEKILELVIARSRSDTRTSEINSTTAEQRRLHDASENTPNFADLYEERVLEEVIARSRLDVGASEINSTVGTAGIDENALLQEAINKSFAEEEEKNFSPMPKVSEDNLIKFVIDLSLNEIHNKQSSNKEHISDEKDWDLCLVCYDQKMLIKFLPCNHKCICKECAEKYESRRCLVCRKFFDELTFDS